MKAALLERFNSAGSSSGGNRPGLIVALGLASMFPYVYSWTLQDLRAHTVEFLIAFGAAFILYGIATTIALGLNVQPGRWFQPAIFGIAIILNALLIFTPPTLSDDMYRYVWDGRVQAQGISPYRYAPDDPNLAELRDPEIWPAINRKSAVTIYPPAAQMAYAVLWRIHPDSVRWFQVCAAGMALLAGVLLLGLLRDLGRSPGRVLIYLWSPLLIYETAHAAHLEGLFLPLLVGAWWARVRERDGLTGFLLGLAAAMKFYPALLLPALWRPNHPKGRWRMPAALVATLVICYLPYLLNSGPEVIGFLPEYLGERFNLSPLLNWLMTNLPNWLDLNSSTRFTDAQRILSISTLAILGLMSLAMIVRPAKSGEQALRRSIWPIGIFTLLNPNLFSWYILWLLPLVALFMDSQTPKLVIGARTFVSQKVSLPRLDAWTGWWLFSGLVALSYTFFIRWETVPLTRGIQFWPLYAFLAIDLARWLRLRWSLRQQSPIGSLSGGAGQ
jgi:hypothetical protein